MLLDLAVGCILMRLVGWCLVQHEAELIDFDTATLIYKSQDGLAPQYNIDMLTSYNGIHGYNTRHALNGLFYFHYNSTYFAQTGGRFNGILLYPRL